MSEKAYILTSEWNAYDQFGEYFIAWFHRKPTPDELRKVMIEKEEEDSCELCCHILNGGGRTEQMEDRWYHLREVYTAAKTPTPPKP